MSFVVVVSTSSVLYTPPNGSENAFAGQTISSATWNATFTDLSNNGLAVVGTAQANTIKGNVTSAVGVVADMTVVQAQALLRMGQIAFPVRGVSFNASAGTDLAVSITVPTSRYNVVNAFISNASASLTSGSVALFTQAGGAGLTIIASTTLTVSGTTTDSASNAQQLNAAANGLSDAALQFRIIVAVSVSATADVILFVRPL